MKRRPQHDPAENSQSQNFAMPEQPQPSAVVQMQQAEKRQMSWDIPECLAHATPA